MRSRSAALAVLALLVAGCVTPDAATTTEDDDVAFAGITPVRDRHALDFRTDDRFSHTLEPGPYSYSLPGRSIHIPVQVSLGNGLPVQEMHLGLFLPDIEGCDWDAAELPEECHVPVIADIGPYYGQGPLYDGPATEPAGRLGAFLIENFVPHGYAVAQVSVFGTGDSGGCMDLMGPVEQAGIHAAVEWLGTQPWSNGAVGTIGRSYDGGTQWQAAMAGSEHLKTIVPISGVLGMHDLMWRNGSAEFRAPGVLWGLYYSFTPTGDNMQDDPARQARQIIESSLCPETQAGLAQAIAAYATGDHVAPAANSYWTSRDFAERVLANYEGSVYFIHGLQDWNTDPHQAFPMYQHLEAKDLEMKGLFGQWAHNYPDRPGEHSHLRWDWAQDLLEWFDHYLKGTGPKPELHVEVQDDARRWRITETWPPRDLEWLELSLGDGIALVTDSNVVTPTSAGLIGSNEGEVVFRSDAFEDGLHLAGLAQLHVTVTPMGPGGQIYAELRDADDNRRLGHGIMDLRFAAGGKDAQPVIPGQPLLAHFEFFAMDAVLPAGHRLELRIANAGWDYLPSVTTAPVRIELGDVSTLRLPVVEPGEDAFFTPPGME